MTDYIGLRLGNYRIVRLIGRGGFASVYQGEHIYLKTPAAIKILNMQLINDGLEKFLQEARIIASLDHPHIVRVLEFGVEGITPFLVMSYANNGTLRQQHSRNSTLPWKSIISYTKQIADALQYAHDHGVIHRDVKPENMLLDKNQHIQLSDFGLAVIAQNMNVQLSSSAGTPAYIAPEQLQGQPCRASDQYALGIIVYEWLCSSLPFTGSAREITIQHLYTPPPPLHTKAFHVSPAMESTIMKALAKDPQARFTTVHEFSQALERIALSETLLNGQNESVLSPRPSKRISSTLFYEHTGAVSSEESTLHLSRQQEPLNASSPSNFLPQLPLVPYESPLPNNRWILQPSLDASIYSLEEPSLSVAFSSEDGTLQSSHTSGGSLHPHTPLPQQLSDLATLNSQQATLGAGGNQIPLLPQPQIVITRHQHTARHVILTALIGIAIIGFIITAGMLISAHFMPAKVQSSLAQLTVLPPPVRTHTTTNSKKTMDKAGSTRVALPSTGNVSASTPLPGAIPGNPPLPAKAPTPLPTSTPISTPTPAPVVPLAVTFVNPPGTATAGTTITIVVQASKGGMTIALNGKGHSSFGVQVANSQGVASFQVKVPFKGKRLVLTAIASDVNGDQVQSSPQIILID